MAKSILKNLFAKGILNVFNALIPLLIIPYVYRILGPDIIGKVEYATALYTYFGLLGLLGIYNYGLREVSRNKNDKVRTIDVYQNLFVIGVISNFSFFLIYEIIVFSFIHDQQLLQIMSILGLQLLAQIFYVEWVNEAYENFKFITVKTVIIRLLSVLCVFLLVVYPEDYIYYIWIFVGVGFINNLVSFIYVTKLFGWNFGDICKLDIRVYLFPLFIVLILNNTNILYTLADRTMLGIYAGVEQVAYYSVGQKITEVIKILLLSVVYVTLPRLSFYLEENKRMYQESIRKLVRLVLLLMLPTAIGMFLLAEPIVMLFAGEQYAGAILALRVFAIRMIFIGTESVLYNNVIFLHRKEKILLLLNVSCGGLNVMLNFLFLDVLSPFIAILTTLSAEIIFQILCVMYIKRVLHMTTGMFDKENLNYVFLSLLFVPIVMLIKFCTQDVYLIILISIFSCGLIYAGGLYLFKDKLSVEICNRLLSVGRIKTNNVYGK